MTPLIFIFFLIHSYCLYSKRLSFSYTTMISCVRCGVICLVGGDAVRSVRSGGLFRGALWRTHSSQHGCALSEEGEEGERHGE